jgi:hypothetical protein
MRKAKFGGYHYSQHLQILGALASCFLIVWTVFHLFLYSRLSTGTNDNTFGLDNSENLAKPLLSLDASISNGATPVYGTYSRFTDNATEVVYAFPKASDSIQGIALVLHACTHSALKFFSPSHDCNECLGLAEELQISRILLRRNYAILAITSQDRKSGCWSSEDCVRIRGALEEFRHLLPIPISKVIAIGASSGGRFAAQLAQKSIAQAALVMVMSLGPSLCDKLTPTTPIYLAPMPRDTRTTQKAKADYEKLKALNPDMPIIFDETTCGSLPVTADYIHQRVVGTTLDMARAIVKSLMEARHLDANHWLLQDPTRSSWRDILRDNCGDVCLQNQILEPGKSPLAKALHRAWAFHEYCSEVVEPALDYFQSR